MSRSLFVIHLPMSAFVRADALDYAIGFQSGDLFLHGFGGYAYSLGERSCA